MSFLLTTLVMASIGAPAQIGGVVVLPPTRTWGPVTQTVLPGVVDRRRTAASIASRPSVTIQDSTEQLGWSAPGTMREEPVAPEIEIEATTRNNWGVYAEGVPAWDWAAGGSEMRFGIVVEAQDGTTYTLFGDRFAPNGFGFQATGVDTRLNVRSTSRAPRPSRMESRGVDPDFRIGVQIEVTETAATSYINTGSGWNVFQRFQAGSEEYSWFVSDVPKTVRTFGTVLVPGAEGAVRVVRFESDL